MKKCSIIVWILLLYSGSLFARQEEKTPFSVDDCMDMVSVGGNFHNAPDGLPETVLMTPDGGKVFYSASQRDWKNNRLIRRFYMIPSEGGDAVPFIKENGGDQFQFSPGGTFLSFLKDVDGISQLFLIRIEDGEARQVTHHPTKIERYAWAKEETVLYFTADDARSEEEQWEYDHGGDAFYVDEGPHGRIAARWRNLWQVDLKDGTERQITRKEHIIDELDVAPDGRHVVIAARPDNRRNYPHLVELYVVDGRSGKIDRLTNNLAPEWFPVWSPDGAKIAYWAPSDTHYELTKGYLWVIDPETKAYTKLNSQHRGEMDHLTWSADSRSLIFNEQHRTNTNLLQVDIATDKLKALTKVTGSLRALAFSEDRSKMVYTFSDFTHPNDLYVSSLDHTDPVRLTDANPWIEGRSLAKSEVLQWKSTDGWTLEGILQIPNGYQKGTRIPLILQIHGGPNQVWSNEFHAMHQVYAGLGYASILPNPRGSSGYGNKLLKALKGEVGKGEYEDVMSAVDHVIDLGIGDPEKLGVRGWSWGGVLSSWVITQTHRFKAASVGAMVGSWLSEMGPGFNWDLTLWYMKKPHWDDPKAWREISSITYVNNVTTPTILLHGDDDWYSSYNQSLIFYSALKDIGKAPARFVSFPGQTHDLFDSKPQRIRIVEDITWFQKYIQGVDWKP